MHLVSRSCKLASVSLLLLVAGCQVSPPGRLERAVARQVKQRITVGGKRDANPLPATPENIRAGQEAFSHSCIVCHGLDGQDTGVPFAEAMSPPVPLLSSPEVQGYTDGQLKWILPTASIHRACPPREAFSTTKRCGPSWTTSGTCRRVLEHGRKQYLYIERASKEGFV